MAAEEPSPEALALRFNRDLVKDAEHVCGMLRSNGTYDLLRKEVWQRPGFLSEKPRDPDLICYPCSYADDEKSDRKCELAQNISSMSLSVQKATGSST
jgi:hypothetical protein